MTKDKKEEKPQYERPQMKSYEAEELEEELGFTLGSGDSGDDTPRFL